MKIKGYIIFTDNNDYVISQRKLDINNITIDELPNFIKRFNSSATINIEIRIEV